MSRVLRIRFSHFFINFPRSFPEFYLIFSPLPQSNFHRFSPTFPRFPANIFLTSTIKILSPSTFLALSLRYTLNQGQEQSIGWRLRRVRRYSTDLYRSEASTKESKREISFTYYSNKNLFSASSSNMFFWYWMLIKKKTHFSGVTFQCFCPTNKSIKKEQISL